MDDPSNPCVTCGACCSRFRVAFYSGDHRVPEALSYPIDSETRAMKTARGNTGSVRCIALQGELGTYVGCGIYENRPQPCRDFRYSYEGGGPREERCDQARIAIGLEPLQPSDVGIRERSPQP